MAALATGDVTASLDLGAAGLRHSGQQAAVALAILRLQQRTERLAQSAQRELAELAELRTKSIVGVVHRPTPDVTRGGSGARGAAPRRGRRGRVGAHPHGRPLGSDRPSLVIEVALSCPATARRVLRQGRPRQGVVEGRRRRQVAGRCPAARAPRPRRIVGASSVGNALPGAPPKADAGGVPRGMRPRGRARR